MGKRHFIRAEDIMARVIEAKKRKLGKEHPFALLAVVTSASSKRHLERLMKPMHFLKQACLLQNEI